MELAQDRRATSRARGRVRDVPGILHQFRAHRGTTISNIDRRRTGKVPYPESYFPMPSNGSPQGAFGGGGGDRRRCFFAAAGALFNKDRHMK